MAGHLENYRREAKLEDDLQRDEAAESESNNPARLVKETGRSKATVTPPAKLDHPRPGTANLIARSTQAFSQRVPHAHPFLNNHGERVLLDQKNFRGQTILDIESQAARNHLVSLAEFDLLKILP